MLFTLTHGQNNALKVKLDERPCQRLSGDRPDHEHANGPQGLDNQAPSPAVLELKKPSGEKAKRLLEHLSPVAQEDGCLDSFVLTELMANGG